MDTRRMFRYGVAVLLLGLLIGVQALGARGDDPVLRLGFEKCDPDGDFVWQGRVSGDLDGSLTTFPTFVDDSTPIWRVEFDFVIDDAGTGPMTIHLIGTLNSETGRVSMSGIVTEGYLLGARVQEAGQLVDAERSCFEGTLRIVAPSARP